jgi:hypothetical protein
MAEARELKLRAEAMVVDRIELLPFIDEMVRQFVMSAIDHFIFSSLPSCPTPSQSTSLSAR